MLLSRASLRCALLGIKCGCACGFKCARYKPELRPAVGPRLASTAMGFVLHIPPPTKFEIERLLLLFVICSVLRDFDDRVSFESSSQ